jgi:hypothetical protein
VALLDGDAAVDDGGDGSGAPVVDRKSYSGGARKPMTGWRRDDGEDGAAATGGRQRGVDKLGEDGDGGHEALRAHGQRWEGSGCAQ